jgi:predicted membrane metal-binding protein
MPLLAGLFFAAFYAWLTGLQPPALRTVIALAVLAALRIAPVNGRLAGLVLLCRGDSDKRSLGRTFAESALSAFAVAALIFWFQWLPLPRWHWAADTAATESDLSAGRDAAAAHAVTGADFPWLQHLFWSRISLPFPW